MTPEEYREAIAALGLTQQGAAKRFFGVDPRASRYWAYLGDDPEKGRAVPEPVARLLILARHLTQSGMTMEEIMRVIQSNRGGDDSR